MTEAPLISIGMSVYNNERTIAVALNSILRQSIANWELILINDGSTDATLEVTQKFIDKRIRIVSYPERRGLAQRLNQTIDMARGKYFARMDGDDVCFPERFARQVDYLESHSETDLLGAGSIFFGSDGSPSGVFLPPADHERICSHPWVGFALPHPSWMGRLEWFRDNRYDARAWKAQDYDLLLRTHRYSCFSAIAEPMIGYRLENLNVRKIISSRHSTIISQWRYARVNRGWFIFVFAVTIQLMKCLIDIAIVGSWFEKYLIRRKIRPLNGEFSERWKTIWRDCQP